MARLDVRIYFPGEHFARDFDLARITRGAGVDPAAMLCEQRNHFKIAGFVSAVSRRARAPYPRIRISATLQQQTRHLDAILNHGLKQRAACRPRLLSDVADPGALIRIET